MADGIDYAEVTHNAKCLAELLFPGEPVIRNQTPEVVIDLILPGYMVIVKRRLTELQRDVNTPRSR